MKLFTFNLLKSAKSTNLENFMTSTSFGHYSSTVWKSDNDLNVLKWPFNSLFRHRLLTGEFQTLRIVEIHRNQRLESQRLSKKQPLGKCIHKLISRKIGTEGTFLYFHTVSCFRSSYKGRWLKCVWLVDWFGVLAFFKAADVQKHS